MLTGASETDGRSSSRANSSALGMHLIHSGDETELGSLRQEDFGSSEPSKGLKMSQCPSSEAAGSGGVAPSAEVTT
jgi:hypothetical protein